MKIDYFLGLGQSTWSQRWLEAHLPEVTFHTAPDYLTANSVNDMIQLGRRTVRSKIDTSTDILIAESQAAPMVIDALAHKVVPLPKRLILLMPLGLNSTSLGSSSSIRTKQLLKRSWQFWRHPDQSLMIAGNRQTLVTLIRQSLPHFLRLKTAYTFGASQNCIRELEDIARLIPVDVYTAEQDSLFPYAELKRVQNSHIRVHPLSGTHLNRATPKGLSQLKRILKQVQ